MQTDFEVLDATPPRRPSPTKTRPSVRFMLSHPAHLFSLGFGSGLSPIMPGTMGTLFGWLSFRALSPWMNDLRWLALIVAGFVAGIAMSRYTARRLGTPDPGAVVWDEIIAMWLVLLFVMPTSFSGQFGAFLLFRFFDMVKPPPVRWFDRNFKGGLGIMLDDIVAAFLTLLVIALWRQ
jgi:phosphatidylglycerophosphatase A